MTASRLQVEAVWKAYPRWSGDQTLRAAVRHRLPALLRPAEQRWALRDVAFDVAAGGAVGLIGGNGAGKSTLLRLAAGIGRPTQGRVLAPSRVAAVLNLGDLFDFSLSGRENALTTAMASGMRAGEARERLPAIFAFAELEGFADAPLRTYSDGMRLRLAFGVIAQLRPDLLLLDEVMAVGDMRFQRKCMEWIRARRSEGAGLVFASHSLEQVEEQCDRAVWLDAGGVRAAGPADEVVGAYRQAMDSETRARTPAPDGEPGALELRQNRFGSQEATISAVVLRSGTGATDGHLASGAPLEVELRLSCPAAAPVEDPIAGVSLVRAADGTVAYDTSTAGEGVSLGTLAGERAVSLVFDRLDLLPGEYFVDVGLYRGDWRYAYDYHWKAHTLLVTGSGNETGIFRPPHAWRA